MPSWAPVPCSQVPHSAGHWLALHARSLPDQGWRDGWYSKNKFEKNIKAGGEGGFPAFYRACGACKGFQEKTLERLAQQLRSRHWYIDSNILYGKVLSSEISLMFCNYDYKLMIFSMTSQGRASTANEVGQVDPKAAKQLLVSYSRLHNSCMEPGIKFFSKNWLVLSCMIVIFF